MASRIAARYVSRRMMSSGKILGEEERAAENIYIKKMEKEKLEKLARKGPENATPTPAAPASAAASTPSAAASSTSKTSTIKNRNYGVIAGVVAGLGGLGWYLMSNSMQPEAQEQD
ncbi:hypothetical protein MKW94_022960 [Papaver nudicaule]|uniref:F1F0-ATPase inhibitor protein n=1 Tax=Papaver nudicaule TaxID=74823 RepID=A0AA41SGQ4_PAPNU|nr:hypothetical protein [Papaver nudicaule]